MSTSTPCFKTTSTTLGFQIALQGTLIFLSSFSPEHSLIRCTFCTFHSDYTLVSYGFALNKISKFSTFIDYIEVQPCYYLHSQVSKSLQAKFSGVDLFNFNIDLRHVSQMITLCFNEPIFADSL